MYEYLIANNTEKILFTNIERAQKRRNNVHHIYHEDFPNMNTLCVSIDLRAKQKLFCIFFSVCRPYKIACVIL